VKTLKIIAGVLVVGWILKKSFPLIVMLGTLSVLAWVCWSEIGWMIR